MNDQRVIQNHRVFFLLIFIPLVLISCKDSSSGLDQSDQTPLGNFSASVSGDISDTFGGGAFIYSSSVFLGTDVDFPCIFMITQSGSYEIYICKFTTGRLEEGEYRIHEENFTVGGMRTNILDFENINEYDIVTGELSITSSESGNLTGEFSFSAEEVYPGSGNVIEIEGSFNAVCEESQGDLPECE